MRISIRADASFAVPEVYIGCETLRLEYTIGLGINSVLKRSETLLEKALKDFTEKAEPQRQFDAFEYQAATWSEPRWVVLKAEANARGHQNELGAMSCCQRQQSENAGGIDKLSTFLNHHFRPVPVHRARDG